MVCCVTGHRSKGFTFPRNSEEIKFQKYNALLREEIKNLIENGYDHFICGMAEGADLDFAQAVISYRDTENPSITLEAALPYPLALTKLTTEYNKKRADILIKCDFQSVISAYYHRGCMQKRNCYMVNKSDLVLAIWNGNQEGGTWNTINYALKKGKPIKYIMLKEI